MLRSMLAPNDDELAGIQYVSDPNTTKEDKRIHFCNSNDNVKWSMIVHDDKDKSMALYTTKAGCKEKRSSDRATYDSQEGYGGTNCQLYEKSNIIETMTDFHKCNSLSKH